MLRGTHAQLLVYRGVTMGCEHLLPARNVVAQQHDHHHHPPASKVCMVHTKIYWVLGPTKGTTSTTYPHYPEASEMAR